jgi:hypothetical protein
MSKPNAELFYAVLSPFKFRGAVVKPPTLVPMSVEEARPYQTARVLSEDAADALPPEPITDAPQTPKAEAPPPAQPATKAASAANKKAVK